MEADKPQYLQVDPTEIGGLRERSESGSARTRIGTSERQKPALGITAAGAA
jgi:hypothetical protein